MIETVKYWQREVDTAVANQREMLDEYNRVPTRKNALKSHISCYRVRYAERQLSEALQAQAYLNTCGGAAATKEGN